jgi:hypothetical protein
MEKPLFEYRNHLRNGLVIVVWILIFWGGVEAIGLTFSLLEHIPNWNPKLDWIVFIVVPTVTITIPGWHIRLLRCKVFYDVIVFKEQGPHPMIENEFGIAFCNIINYKVKAISFGLYWIVIKRSNGKPIWKLISLSERELTELLKTLSYNVNITN